MKNVDGTEAGHIDLKGGRVEIQIANDKVWLHVNGQTLCRIYDAEIIQVDSSIRGVESNSFWAADPASVENHEGDYL